MDWQLMVPFEPRWAEAGAEEAREVRLRPGQPVTVIRGDGIWRGSHILTPAEITQAAQALSGYGLAAHRAELNRGFLPLPGGHRLGVCGVTGPDGVTEITSLCVRITHEIKGAGEEIFPLIRGRSALIVGPPGTGKTTLLRDLARLYALAGYQVAVADDRGEIAACREGAPQLDVGPGTDVVTGMEKPDALRLLIRAMSPQVIVTDEIGGPEDGAAIAEALRCGVLVLATAHGRSVEDVARRPALKPLTEAGAFERFVLLEGAGRPAKVMPLV